MQPHAKYTKKAFGLSHGESLCKSPSALPGTPGVFAATAAAALNRDLVSSNWLVQNESDEIGQHLAAGCATSFASLGPTEWETSVILQLPG